MKKKILFICSANLNRSPTCESWFKKNRPDLETRSAGIHYGYPYQVNKEILEWADRIFVMDISQYKFLWDRYGFGVIRKTEIMGISDQYDRDSPELLRLIEFWANDVVSGL